MPYDSRPGILSFLMPKIFTKFQRGHPNDLVSPSRSLIHRGFSNAIFLYSCAAVVKISTDSASCNLSAVAEIIIIIIIII